LNYDIRGSLECVDISQFFGKSAQLQPQGEPAPAGFRRLAPLGDFLQRGAPEKPACCN